MSWTIEQLAKHPKRAELLGVNIKSKVKATPKVPAVKIEEPGLPGLLTFTVVGDPMGKPRMTQRDRWQKRPAVLRYRDYCDRIREAAPTSLKSADVYAVMVTAYIAMAASWSKRKQAEHNGTPHRLKPDWDNIGKAICDALFEDDAMISDGRTRKFWCPDGQQRTEIKIWFHPKTGS